MGLQRLAEDYLFLGPLIERRLLDEVPDIPVDLCERPDQVLAADRRARVILVMWAGDRFAGTDAGRARMGGDQIVYQRWLVVLGLNNVGKPGDARNSGAGPWLSRIHKALAGYRPDGAVRAMYRANAPLAPTFTDSKAVYPLGFEIELSL